MLDRHVEAEERSQSDRIRVVALAKQAEKQEPERSNASANRETDAERAKRGQAWRNGRSSLSYHHFDQRARADHAETHP
jgi:hypothetical protein